MPTFLAQCGLNLQLGGLVIIRTRVGRQSAEMAVLISIAGATTGAPLGN